MRHAVQRRIEVRGCPRIARIVLVPCIAQFKNNHFTEMCCGTEAGSYLRLIDSCITQLRPKDLLGPVKKVEKKKKTCIARNGAPQLARDLLERRRRLLLHHRARGACLFEYLVA